MPLSAPRYRAGRPEVKKGAYALFTHCGWIYRRCEEFLAEADLDPVKLYDLAGHCFSFRQEAQKWLAGADYTGVLAELVDLTRTEAEGNVQKTPLEINQDYKQLHAEAGVFLVWADANLPPAGAPVPNAIVTVNRAWPNTDFIVRVSKGAAVTARVQALRDVFL